MAYVQLEDLYGAIEAVVFPKTLAQYEALIQPGQVILVTGRLDIQEEKEPKLLMERVATSRQKENVKTVVSDLSGTYNSGK